MHPKWLLKGLLWSCALGTQFFLGPSGGKTLDSEKLKKRKIANGKIGDVRGIMGYLVLGEEKLTAEEIHC